jgi:hypothetical protein
MNIFSNTFVCAFALTLAASIAAAQNPPSHPQGGGEAEKRPRPPIDAALDANSDETIDVGEIANAVAALKKLDKNGDGQLTADEYRPQRPGGRGKGYGRGKSGGDGQPPDTTPADAQNLPQGGGQMQGDPPTQDQPLPPIVTALDANGDSVIDAGELAKAVAALKKLDKNGDGKLSPDEYRPLRPDGPCSSEGTNLSRGSQ